MQTGTNSKKRLSDLQTKLLAVSHKSISSRLDVHGWCNAVLKAGEKALTTKIDAQKKDLHAVLTAMTNHKQRQSVAFKYTPPDLKVS